LSHHGSRKNTTDDLLASISCPRYLVSTDGARHGHPDSETIRRILDSQKPTELFFNYLSAANSAWADPKLQAEHGFTAHYPSPGGEGLVIRLA
jgi:hypothetical protein